MPNPALVQAFDLAAQGRSAEALDLIAPRADAGEPDALYALGLWHLEGRHVARDLAEAHRLVAVAEAKGLVQAARTLSAFLCLGIGGEPDWDLALAVLERWRERDPLAARQLDLLAQPRREIERETLSESPRIERLPAFLSADEVAWLIEMAAPRFRAARVFDERQQRFVVHPYRDALVASFPAPFEWPAVHVINRRIAEASGTAVAQGEPLQILRYGPGQSYRPHLDAVPGLANQRIFTLLIALNSDFDGGATEFPGLELSLRGRPGDALLFRNADDDGLPDRRTLHAGLAVRAGTKMIASRWIRQRPPNPGDAFGAHEVGKSDG